jgi:hypothetical protein
MPAKKAWDSDKKARNFALRRPETPNAAWVEDRLSAREASEGEWSRSDALVFRPSARPEAEFASWSTRVDGTARSAMPPSRRSPSSPLRSPSPAPSSRPLPVVRVIHGDHTRTGPRFHLDHGFWGWFCLGPPQRRPTSGRAPTEGSGPSFPVGPGCGRQASPR